MSRHWLIGVSVLAHMTLVSGVFLAGTARLERLDPGRLTVNLTQQPVSPPEPAAAGGPKKDTKPPDPQQVKERKPPKKRPDSPRQPEPLPPPEQVATTGGTGDTEGPGTGTGTNTESTCLENCGDAPPAAPVCGNAAVETGEQCDDGNTAAGDGCSPTCRTEPKTVATVAPSVLQGLRVSGETQLRPSAATQSMMARDGTSQVRGTVKLCVATDGRVSAATLLVSTKYSEYDATLLSAVRGWQYRPYTLNNTPVPACSTVTFVYTIK